MEKVTLIAVHNIKQGGDYIKPGTAFTTDDKRAALLKARGAARDPKQEAPAKDAAKPAE